MRGGTLAPLRRALDSPIAMACLRFFTGCLPDFMWCISVRTSCCAFLPYLRPRELPLDLDEVERLREDELERRDRLPDELLRDDLLRDDRLRDDLLLLAMS